MPILPALAREFQGLFPLNDHGQERFQWFVLTLKAILVPLTVSRTSNLLRAIETLFGVSICGWTRVWNNIKDGSPGGRHISRAR
jgi:hypothetical protein